jgi:hypothetical protein
MPARSRERSALGSRTLDASGESQRAPPPRSRVRRHNRPANLSAGPKAARPRWGSTDGQRPGTAKRGAPGTRTSVSRCRVATGALKPKGFDGLSVHRFRTHTRCGGDVAMCLPELDPLAAPFSAGGSYVVPLPRQVSRACSGGYSGPSPQGFATNVEPARTAFPARASSASTNRAAVVRPPSARAPHAASARAHPIPPRD